MRFAFRKTWAVRAVKTLSSRASLVTWLAPAESSSVGSRTFMYGEQEKIVLTTDLTGNVVDMYGYQLFNLNTDVADRGGQIGT